MDFTVGAARWFRHASERLARAPTQHFSSCSRPKPTPTARICGA